MMVLLPKMIPMGIWIGLALIITKVHATSTRVVSPRSGLWLRGGGDMDDGAGSIAAKLAMAATKRQSGSTALPVGFVLDGLMRPKNVGSIFITAEAMVAEGGVWTTGSTPLPSEQAVREAAVGKSGSCAADKGVVPHAHFESVAEAISVLRDAGVAVWACSVDENAVTLEAALDDHFSDSGDGGAALPAPAIALVMGNERTGVTCAGLCDRVVYMPVFENRALNVAVPAGQAAFLVADRYGLAREAATVARLGTLLGLSK